MVPNRWEESDEYLLENGQPRVMLDLEAIKELESCDAEELVQLLNLTTENILKAFPGHVHDYVCTNKPVMYQSDETGYEYEESSASERYGIRVYQANPDSEEEEP